MSDLSSIERMPRGGPDASLLDRLLQTTRLEYTDRYDIPDDVKQKVINGLEKSEQRFGHYEKIARAALKQVSDCETPRILELGAGHGRLSEKILELHLRAEVTASDLDPSSVANMAAGALGSHPRASTRIIDATAIDEPDSSYDLVIMSAGFHHLPPRMAAEAIAEATRVGRKFLVIDSLRAPPVMLAALTLTWIMVYVMLAPFSSLRPTLHDGLISLLRFYSRSALVALAKAAHPEMLISFESIDIRFLRVGAVVMARPLNVPAESSD